MATQNPTTLKKIILLTILLACKVRDTIAFGFGPFGRVTVTIINEVIAPDLKTITVHCKSQDDDLGFHTLLFGGSYAFSFKPKFLTRNTLFFCGFTWPENPYRHYLDIYDYKHDNCENCTWHINKSGGCLNDHKCGFWKDVELIDEYNNSKWTQTKELDEIGHANPPTF